jgi:hypothetical protein
LAAAEAADGKLHQSRQMQAMVAPAVADLTDNHLAPVDLKQLGKDSRAVTVCYTLGQAMQVAVAAVVLLKEDLMLLTQWAVLVVLALLLTLLVLLLHMQVVVVVDTDL